MASDWDSWDLQHINDEIDRLTQSITENENQLRKRGDNLTTDDWLQNDLQCYRDKLSSLQEIIADKQSVPSVQKCAEAEALKSLDVAKEEYNLF